MFRKLLLALIMTGICLVPDIARADFDAAADFSATSNPNGVWSYGWTQTLGSSFILDAIHENSFGLDFWEGSIETDSPPGFFPTVFHNGTVNTIYYFDTVAVAAGQLGLHPGPDGQYGVVRFTAPAHGTYSIDSAFTGIDFFTATDVHLLVNEASIFDGEVVVFDGVGIGSGPSFSTLRALQAGDTIDFAVGFGSPIIGSYFNDSTGLAAQIRVVPEPVSLIMLWTGLVGMLSYAGCRRASMASANRT
jgi:hypothetical protein